MMTCLCVLTLFAQHKRWGHDPSSQRCVAGMAVSSVVLGLQTEGSRGSKKTHRQRTAHRPESLVGRNFVASISVILRNLFDIPGEFFQEDASCGNSQQRQRTRCAGQETLRGQGRRSRLRYATARLQTKVSSTDGGGANKAFDESKAILLLLHEEDAEHTGGSKGEGSEPNLHRLMDRASIRPRTVQKPRIVVASRFPSDFLYYRGSLRRQQHP